MHSALRPMTFRPIRSHIHTLYLLALLFWGIGMFGKAYAAEEASPQAIDIPPWFEETFLNLPDDIREAATHKKRLMVYFGQDGCPYCKALMQHNFSQKDIVDLTRKNFTAIALNIWGDREVTAPDGRKMSEKDFAQAMKVQFTPTLVFFDEKGKVVARLNGYYPPHRFRAALAYVAGHMENKLSLGEYLKKVSNPAASAELHEEAFFMRSPYNLAKAPKPLAVVFETPHCKSCDEMHQLGFKEPNVQALLKKFTVARFSLGGKQNLTTPDGKATDAAAWATQLRISYTPTIVFFDATGKEVFRVEAYLRPFHLASALDYVASGAYKTQPNFQRFVQSRADALRAKGAEVQLW